MDFDNWHLVSENQFETWVAYLSAMCRISTDFLVWFAC